MGLKITDNIEHADGTMSDETYTHISEYYKPKDKDIIQIATRWYKNLALREASVDNLSKVKDIPNTTFQRVFTMDEFEAIDNTPAAVYAKYKSMLEAMGYTVVNQH